MPDNGSLTIQLDPETAAELAERARAEGVSPEQYAAELIASDVGGSLPPLNISDEGLRASVETQRREIAAGAAKLYSQEEVMAGARAILAKAAAAGP